MFFFQIYFYLNAQNIYENEYFYIEVQFLNRDLGKEYEINLENNNHASLLPVFSTEMRMLLKERIVFAKKEI